MKTKTDFTLKELLGVIAIITILAAILFPVFAKAVEGEKAKQAQCISNLKKIGSALKQYAQDYDETLPLHIDNITYPIPRDGHFTVWVQFGSNASPTILPSIDKYRVWMDIIQPYAKKLEYFCM